MLNKTCTYILDIVIDEKRGLQLPPPKSAYFKQAKRLLNSGIRLKYKIIINREWFFKVQYVWWNQQRNSAKQKKKKCFQVIDQMYIKSLCNNFELHNCKFIIANSKKWSSKHLQYSTNFVESRYRFMYVHESFYIFLLCLLYKNGKDFLDIL